MAGTVLSYSKLVLESSVVKDVEVYCRGLEVDLSRLDQLQQHLSEAERQRAARFHFERHRSAFIAARGILREILGETLGVDPAAIRFQYNTYGKPSVDGPAVHFNVSHSGELALYAISKTREVGVDIERVNPAFAHDRIPERFFSPCEVAALRALPEGDQIDAFFRCWTRKEAYVKARGAGLSLDLKSFAVTVARGAPARFLRGVEGWSIESIDPAPGYVAALVAGD
jgi:4'-phosphopantetheinyl transferase